MVTPCEIAVKSVVPAIRARIAIELVETYNRKQSEVADSLGISQSAVSKYTRQSRGHVIEIHDIEEIRSPISEAIKLIVDGKYKRTEFLRLLCHACTIIRKKRLMCKFCQKADPKIKIEECDCAFCSYI